MSFYIELHDLTLPFILDNPGTILARITGLRVRFNDAKNNGPWEPFRKGSLHLLRSLVVAN